MKKLLQALMVIALIACGLSPLRPMYGQVATLGTGTVTNTMYNPVSVGGTAMIWILPASKTTHIQVVYTAAQINAAGITGPRMLDSLAWDVSQVPAQAIKNYTIKAKLHHQDSVTAYASTNLVTVFNQATYTPSLGWSWIAFQTPMYWNGVDNILFDICSDTFGVASSGRVRMTSLPYNSPAPPSWRETNSTEPLCGIYSGGYSSRLRPNIKLAFRAAPACSGVPASVAISPAGPISGCAGGNKTLAIDVVPNTPVSIQWQQSVNGAAWANVPANGNSVAYDVTVMSGVAYVDYRAIISCTATGATVTSNTVKVNTAGNPAYATLPYTQDFESWSDRCNVTDVPDSHWVNTVAMGPFSWRREDQGPSAGWTDDVTPLYYHPVSSTGSHSARIQSSKGPDSGALLLHVNCSGPGDKDLRFDYMSKTLSENNLTILYSANGGTSFDSLTTFGSMGVNAQWQSYVVPIPSTSATTVIQFKCTSDGSQSGDFDMGIDNVRIYPSCEGKPVAGTVDSVSACPGSGITLSLNGSSASSGLTWLWQETTNGIGWTDIPGGNVEHPNTPLNQATWYRCIVTCTNSGQSDTTAPLLASIKSFYHCYCNSGSTVASPGINIGNVKIFAMPNATMLVDNGNPLPATGNLDAKKHYTDYTNVAPADLYRDSTYKLFLTYFTNNGTNVFPQMGGTYTKAWIDFNHNGTFDADEQVMGHQKESDIFVDSASFTIPATAIAGLTGMRIVTNDDYDTTTVQPCGPYAYGETEDYLVRLWNMPCDGAATAGAVTASDSLSCPGYPFTLSHSGYDTTSGQISRVWQRSSDGTTWADIAGSDNLDTWTLQFTTKYWYRVKMSCAASASNTYSDSVLVGLSNACYCVSYADGGFAGMADSSDIGGFSFATLSFPLTGGHLNNPDAIRKYTSHTYRAPLELWADSTYNYVIDHTILRNDHADAKITLFIDYNGNGTYDIPAERILSVVSASSAWHKTGSIVIPNNVTTTAPVGMRLIINNDTAANVPSDEACGIYTSGETEDYRLLFKKPGLGIDPIAGIANAIHIFPNPSTGIVSVRYNGNRSKAAVLKVQNVAGQVLESIHLSALENGQVIKLNFEGYAKGIYFITLGAEGSSITGKVAVQ